MCNRYGRRGNLHSWALRWCRGKTAVMDEELLQGGVANAGAVVRVGPHVLRPSNQHSAVVHRFLSALHDVGFDGVPLPVGIDPDGRERLRFVDGEVPIPPYPLWAQSETTLRSIVDLMVRFHDASQHFDPSAFEWNTDGADPRGGTVICHNDVCLENVVFRDGRAVALIDFEFAAPGRPLFDLASFARMAIPIDDNVSSARLGWRKDLDIGGRLRLVADAFGLSDDERIELIDMIELIIERHSTLVQQRTAAGEPGFVTMWNAMGGQERLDRRWRWWIDNRTALQRTLLEPQDWVVSDNF